MLQIHPIREKAKLESLYNKHGLCFSDDCIAVFAMDGEELIGYCLFSMSAQDISVKILVPTDDIMLADGILRSALHVAVENGKTNAYYEKTAPENIFKTLGFIKNVENRCLDINKLFESCQSCSKN